MRAVPMITPNPGTGNRLPTPMVKSTVVKQTVDLKPAGATVAIRTLADNPFEGGQRVSIVTQASGGMPNVPESMQSRRIMHSYLPGMGQSATELVAQDQSVPQTIFSAAQTAAEAYTTREQRRQAEAEAAAEIARQRTERRRISADAAARRAILDTSATLPGGFKVNVPLLIIGGGLLAFALMRRSRSRSS